MADRTRDLLEMIGRAAHAPEMPIDAWAQEARERGAEEDFIAAGRQIRAHVEAGLSNESLVAAIDRATNLVLYFL